MFENPFFYLVLSVILSLLILFDSESHSSSFKIKISAHIVRNDAPNKVTIKNLSEHTPEDKLSTRVYY